MNKCVLWVWGAVVSVCLGLASCGEDTEAVDPYADWAVRNEAFLDSIVAVSQTPPADEQWETVLNYKLQNGDEMGGSTSVHWGKSDYVYMKRLPYGTDVEEGIAPMSTDTVYVHYRGKLINGTVFDESYSGEWRENIHESVKFAASAVITGWTTALLHMKEGQRVELYLPYNLAYGASGQGDIPGYSTLIFDVRLEKVKHPSGPDDRSLKRTMEVPLEE